MDRQQAERIIENTFNSPYDEGRFISFTSNLLNNAEFDTIEYHEHHIPNSYKSHIKKYKSIGNYTDPNGESLSILTVHLKNESSLERSRTMQRNFIAWYIKNKTNDENAVVAFHADSMEDWRFSFVKMEFRQEMSDSGVIKVKEELTPTRFSFLVGKNEPNHTPQSQIVPILEDDDNDPTIDIIQEAFTVESVTKLFFSDYRSLFEKLDNELQRILDSDDKIKSDFEDKSIQTDNFAKKLLGQIVFLYFIQKKGWMGVIKDESGNFNNWGSGPKRFLDKLYKGDYCKYDNLFNDVLEPLFYEALSFERDDDYYSRFDCKIPFLNGGLFEPINGYNWNETDIVIHNDIIKEIFDTFNKYNFTVREDEPLEREVAVDPEMLGKVFENLLPENLRKGKAAYYTPRIIVHFMCQESLINYLHSKCENISKEDISEFIHHGESWIESDAAKESGSVSYTYLSPKDIRENASLLDEKLSLVKICDPAIGSGAFPLGIINEIVKARKVLSTYIKEDSNRNIYNFKRQCIQSSIYGVDLDPGAIEIAKLRLWLSLIVDEDDYNNIQPLPNLAFKIMQGNSLIEDFHGISLNIKKDENSNETLFVDKSDLDLTINEMHIKQQEFFNEVRPLEKKRLKGEIEESLLKIFHNELKKQKKDYFITLDKMESIAKTLSGKTKEIYLQEEKEKIQKRFDNFNVEKVESELLEMTHGNKIRNFFPWKLYFADVFRDNGGFDIIIANPPYMRIQEIQKSIPQDKKYYEEYYTVAEGAYDLANLFFERAIYISNQDSSNSFIFPHKFFNSASASVFRDYLKNGKYIDKITHFGANMIFDEADTYTCIAQFSSSPNTGFNCYKSSFNDNFFLKMQDKSNYGYTSYDELDQISKLYGTNQWIIFDNPNGKNVFKILYKDSKKVKDVFEGIYQGIATSKDDLYIGELIEEKSKSYVLNFPKLELQFEVEKEYFKPIIKGKNVKRYCDLKTHLYVFFPYTINGENFSIPNLHDLKNKFPMTYNYIMANEDLFKSRERGKAEKMDNWYAYIYPKNITTFEKQKLSSMEICSKHSNVTINNKLYHTTTVYSWIKNDNVEESYEYLLAIANSKLLWWFLLQTGDVLQGDARRFKTNYLNPFPLPEKVTKEKEKPIVDLVNQILSSKKENSEYDTSPFENEIDTLVYELYGLNNEEITIIEDSVG